MKKTKCFPLIISILLLLGSMSITSFATSWSIASEYDGLDASIRTNCVFFARYKVPSLPSGLNSLADKEAIINSYTPTVGSIAITSGNSSYGHVAYVEAVNGNQITTLNGGFSGTVNGVDFTGHIVRISGTASELGIRGYWNPGGTPDSTGPTVEDFHVSAILADGSGFTLSAKVTDPSGIKSVQYATWTEKNDQDDLKWYDGYCTEQNDYFWHTVNFADHNNEMGLYIFHLYAYDSFGNRTIIDLTYDFASAKGFFRK